MFTFYPHNTTKTQLEKKCVYGHLSFSRITKTGDSGTDLILM